MDKLRSKSEGEGFISPVRQEMEESGCNNVLKAMLNIQKKKIANNRNSELRKKKS